MEVTPDYAAHEYRDKMTAHLEDIESRAKGAGMDYFLVDTSRPLDAALTQRWVTPLLTDAGVRADTARFMRGVRPAALLDVSARLGRFTRPVLLLWGTGDRFFTLPLGRRLAAAFPDARLVEVEGGHTFLPLDEPDRVAREISTFLVPA